MSEQGPVLVTGGSGFIGSWCVIGLLQRGYAVRATVRSLDGEALEHLHLGARTLVQTPGRSIHSRIDHGIPSSLCVWMLSRHCGCARQ